MSARWLLVLASLDVASDECCDREVTLVEFGALGWVGGVGVGHDTGTSR